MTIDLAPEAEAALEKVIALSGKTRNELATAAFSSYAAWYEYESQKIEESIAAADRGEVIDHDELFDDLERRYSSEPC